MTYSALTTPSERDGSSARSGASRFFHVMGQGWFLCTREGVQGPFLDRHRANQCLLHLMSAGPKAPNYQLAGVEFDAWR